MENIVELIHKEIDEAHILLVERLKENSQKISKEKSGLSNEDLDVYKKLPAFDNIPIKKKVREIQEKENELWDKSSSNNNFKRAIKTHKDLFPFNKFLDLTELYKILEKYNLFLGRSDFFIGDIPVENAKKIIEFDDKIEDMRLSSYNFSSQEPLCFIADNTYKYDSHYGGNGGYGEYCIVAPREDFKEDLMEIGQELITKKNAGSIKTHIDRRRTEKLEDPIVLKPMLFNEKLLLTVVTKWGPEAVYPEFQNAIEN